MTIKKFQLLTKSELITLLDLTNTYLLTSDHPEATQLVINEIREELENWTEPKLKRFVAMAKSSRILSVNAPDARRAEMLIDEQLCRPGRYDSWQSWKQAGRVIVEEEITE